MRTTVTIDPDVEVLLKQAMREQRKAFKQVLNNALRDALGAKSTQDVVPFRQYSYSLGLPNLDLTKALSLASELDDQQSIARYRA